MQEHSVHSETSASKVDVIVTAGNIYGSVIHDSISQKSLTPHQLPSRPPECVGRADEIAALDGPARIVALTGPGGIGKTCLALSWAHRRLDEFPDGELFADLQGFSPTLSPRDPADVLGEFLGALGVPAKERAKGTEARASQFRTLVAKCKLLIVLDNAVDADQIEHLLPGGSDCHVVVTSRNQLSRLRTKHRAVHIALDTLSPDHARNLLVAQLGADRVAAESDAADELIHHCGGYPLALSIVVGQASDSAKIPLAEVAAGLRDSASRLRALDDEDDVISFRTVLSWSWRALPPRRAVVFAQLGIAAGPDIGLAAAASLTGLTVEETRAELDGLVRVSLIQHHVAGRWRLHDLVRLVAAEQVRDCAGAARRRLIDFYLHTAMSADRALSERLTVDEPAPPAEGCRPLAFEKKDKVEARAWFKTEHLCLLAAQRDAERSLWRVEVCQFARALDTFHRWAGQCQDNLETWRAALKAALDVGDPVLLSRCYRLLGDAYTRAGVPAMALTHLCRALAIATRADDLRSEASTLEALCKFWHAQGDFVAGLRHAEEVLAKRRRIGDPLGIALALSAVGTFNAELHDMTAAHDNSLDALSRFQKLDHEPGIARTLGNLGDISQELGQHSRSLDYYRSAAELCGKLGDGFTEADCRTGLGHALRHLGDNAGAAEQWRLALELRRAQQRDGEAKQLAADLAELGVAEPAT